MIMDEQHLEILTSHVFDHDRLVTYKSLSKELQVHVNMAKQILWAFYEKYHDDRNIEFTYLLIGTLKDNGIRVEVVRESSLSRAKEKFSNIISEHLYSVHKPLEDLEQLSSSGIGDAVSGYSAITCDACIERNDEEMHLLRWGTKKVTENDMNSESIKPANLNTDKKSTLIKKNGSNILLFDRSTSSSKSKRHEMSRNSVNSTEKDKSHLSKDVNIAEKDKNLTMEKKEQDSVCENKDTAENERFLQDKILIENHDISCEEKNKGLIEKDRDFIKNSGTKRIFPKTEEKMKKAMKKSSLVGLNLFEMASLKSTEGKITEQKNDKAKKKSPEILEKKEKEKIHGKKRKRKSSRESSNSIAKKRKRIVVESDSSDSEMQSDDDDDDIEREKTMTETAEEDEAPNTTKELTKRPPSPPRMKHENGKRKVLKLVNKTYKEGEYMVTKKEHIYVSCSEEEDEEEEEKTRRRREPLKITTAKTEKKMKKKQTVLTNFFKKS